MTEALTEFDIIRRYFQVAGLAAEPGRHPQVQLGIGDDCALLTVPVGQQLALSMDLLNEGVHFPPGAPPGQVARRALAVNLSDLAAMGASPLGFTLGLSLPSAEPAWLAGFSEGLCEMAQEYACPLLGGDITRSADQRIGIALQIHGLVAAEGALRRNGAKVGDRVMVSGCLGGAAAALPLVKGESVKVSPEDRGRLESRYYNPQPRLALGRKLVGIASAAIDVSDGLLADLGHIARASHLGVRVNAPQVPVSSEANRVVGQSRALHYALCGGDDYELAFTVPPSRCQTVAALSRELGLEITDIGEVVPGEGVLCLDEQEQPLDISSGGYEHFRP